MTLAFIVLALVFFALRGIIEGMVMHTDLDRMRIKMPRCLEGVRRHPLFPSYHALCLCRDGLLAGCAALLAEDHSLIPLVYGVLVLGWELSELGYAAARNGIAIARYPENFMGLGFHVSVPWVYYLHGMRGFAGSLLLLRAL